MNELLTRVEVMAVLKVSKATVIRMENAGRLRKIKLGPNMVRLRRSDLETLIEQASIREADRYSEHEQCS